MIKKTNLTEVDEIALEAIGFDNFEYGFNNETGQPHSGTRQIIRDNIRDRGIPAIKYHFLDSLEVLVEKVNIKKIKRTKEGD